MNANQGIPPFHLVHADIFFALDKYKQARLTYTK